VVHAPPGTFTLLLRRLPPLPLEAANLLRVIHELINIMHIPQIPATQEIDSRAEGAGLDEFEIHPTLALGKERNARASWRLGFRPHLAATFRMYSTALPRRRRSAAEG
jgi:hypothetical protein